MPIEQQLKKARSDIDTFDSDIHAPDAARYLDRGLESLLLLYESSAAEQKTRTVIKNIVSRLLGTIINEAERLRHIQPFEPLDIYKRWWVIMRIPHELGWEYPQRYKKAAMDHKDLTIFLMQSEGHVSREERNSYLDWDDLS